MTAWLSLQKTQIHVASIDCIDCGMIKQSYIPDFSKTEYADCGKSFVFMEAAVDNLSPTIAKVTGNLYNERLRFYPFAAPEY